MQPRKRGLSKVRADSPRRTARPLALERLEDRLVPASPTLSDAVGARIGVLRPTGNTFTLSLDANGNGTFDGGDTVLSLGQAGDRFLVGDWDGDGSDEVGVVRPQFDGSALILLDQNGNGTFDSGDRSFTFGRASDTFVVGDWDGDGRAKIGVVRPNGGTALFSLDSDGDGAFTAADQVFLFGAASDRFLIGDWDGDGTAQVGVERPFGITASFSLDSNGNGAFDGADQVFLFGAASDQFLVGDWDGDGRAQIGVVRPAGALSVFSLDANGNGAFDGADHVFTFGLASDTFLVGRWRSAPALSQTPELEATAIPGLTQASFQALIDQAIANWAAAGLSARGQQLLRTVRVTLTDRTDGALGVTAGTSISLDTDAVGYGWYIDPTPGQNEEFPVQGTRGLQATSGEAASKMDMLTVLTHEMGHALGLHHTARPGDLMSTSLPPGFRRLPSAQNVADLA